jgi:hypothetical protein
MLLIAAAAFAFFDFFTGVSIFRAAVACLTRR